VVRPGLGKLSGPTMGRTKREKLVKANPFLERFTVAYLSRPQNARSWFIVAPQADPAAATVARGLPGSVGNARI